MPLSYPNETDAYRSARNDLLDAEIALRAQIEVVAVMRLTPRVPARPAPVFLTD